MEYPVYLLDLLGPSGSPPPNDMVIWWSAWCWCSSVLYMLLSHMQCRVYMQYAGTVLSTMLPVVRTVLILGELVI